VGGKLDGVEPALLLLVVRELVRAEQHALARERRAEDLGDGLRRHGELVDGAPPAAASTGTASLA
jgi:hypothetical protein